MISRNLEHIQSHIASVCKRLGRNPQEITLIGVTKYAPIEYIKEAIQAGLRNIGENRIQDAQEKFPILAQMNTPVAKHMIGHLQTNKAKKAVELFDLIQSVDSLKLASEIEKEAKKLNKNIDILIQVNTSNEPQKSGVAADGALKLVEEVLGLEHVRIKGLMTIGPLTEDKDVLRGCFKALKALYDECAEKYASDSRVSMKYLSMGMSGDYEIALEEGANMVRIGSAIFKNG